MATLTNEQIEQKKQLLAEKLNEMNALTDELVEAGALSLSEKDLEKVAGGRNNDNPQSQNPQAYLDRLAIAERLIREADEERRRKWGRK